MQEEEEENCQNSTSERPSSFFLSSFHRLPSFLKREKMWQSAEIISAHSVRCPTYFLSRRRKKRKKESPSNTREEKEIIREEEIPNLFRNPLSFAASALFWEFDLILLPPVHESISIPQSGEEIGEEVSTTVEKLRCVHSALTKKADGGG